MSTDREEGPVRIAMWSGPRNISTAMMRSFENRPDTAVWDEPFYAAYLAATGLAHPMRDDVIAAGIPDPSEVVRRILGPPPGGAAVFYQKHMAHHMIDGFDRGWMERVVHCFLIRTPERVLASYAARRQQVRLADIGFVQQHALFERVAQRTGAAPPVLDAADVLDAPEAMLRGLCAACGIAFMTQMLHWPAGPRESDGIWGRHWYASVWKSTGFAGPDPAGAKRPALPDALRRIADRARPHYDALWRHRMQPADIAAG